MRRLVARFLFSILLLFGQAGIAAELTMAIVGYPSPDPKEPLVDKTIEQIQKRLTDHRVKIRNIHFMDMPQALQAGQVDLFLSSPGLYRELQELGARDLVAICTSQYANPNQSEASAIVTLSENRHIENIADLKGKTVAVKSLTGFVSYYVPIWEILHKGYEIDGFFKREVVVDARDFGARALHLLRSREVDSVFLKHCLLEDRLRQHPEEKGLYRVLDEQQKPGECKRSTRLYPSWVLATAKSLPGDVSREILRIVLDTSARTNAGIDLYWSVATDYSAIDELYRDLKLGPYAYLREWTVRRFLETYWGVFLFVLCGIIGLFFHSVSVNRLVRKRTAELESSLSKEHRLQQETVLLSNKLERMQRMGALKSFVSVLAHELFQPIASIRFYVDALREVVHEDKEVGRILAGIEKQANLCGDIIDRVRNYIRAEHSEHRALDFSALTQRVLANFESTQCEGVRIQTMIEPSHMVVGDQIELELLIVNLLRNAVEAARSVQEGRVTVILKSNTESLALSIADNGRALTDEEFKHLGETFSTTKIQGLGLGLSIVKDIAEKHHAKLLFTRLRPCGLEVVFTLATTAKAML